jgi:hypothetical protein
VFLCRELCRVSSHIASRVYRRLMAQQIAYASANINSCAWCRTIGYGEVGRPRFAYTLSATQIAPEDNCKTVGTCFHGAGMPTVSLPRLTCPHVTATRQVGCNSYLASRRRKVARSGRVFAYLVIQGGDLWKITNKRSRANQLKTLHQDNRGLLRVDPLVCLSRCGFGRDGSFTIVSGTGQGKWGNFIAQWVPTCLIIGVYNKLVKLEGHDKFDRAATLTDFQKDMGTLELLKS